MMERTEALEESKQTTSQLQQPPPISTPLIKIIMVASIAVGLQFGWALQLSLLTPYVQLLGIPHKWAAFIWLCGPISGLLVQPIVGYYSDRCTSRFGRRRPFIASGAAFIAIAVFLIGYAADIGHHTGDSLAKKAKPRAIAIFVVGFWIFDVANNTLQGPSRAFLADLSGANHRKTRVANACYTFFAAIGNVLGYAAGSYNKLHKIFPFTVTKACDVYCANLKSCFFISISLLLGLTVLALSYVREKPWSPEQGIAGGAAYDNGVVEEKDTPATGKSATTVAIFCEIYNALKNLHKPMRVLLLVNGLTWIAWFPFLLYDTDWMGREVYGGNSNGNTNQMRLYDKGVRAGALGLMLNSVVVLFMSFGLEVFARGVGGVKRLWAIVNFFLAICLSMTILITRLAESSRQYTTEDGGRAHLLPPPVGIKAGALTLFAVMGIPLAITYSIPYALASIFSSTSGAGQGLSLGVLNLSIVIPQMVVSLLSGPWDALFGGGNLPAFVVAAVAAIASGIFAITILPSPPPDVQSTINSSAFH